MDQSPKQDNFDEQTLDQLQDGQSLTFNEGLEQWDDLSLDGVEFQSIQPTPQQNNVAQDQSQQYQSEPHPKDPLSEPPLMEEPNQSCKMMGINMISLWAVTLYLLGARL
jgi:hypothetical protein